MQTKSKTIEEILLDLQIKISSRGMLIQELRELMQLPLEKPPFCWEQEQAYCWIHATDDFSNLGQRCTPNGRLLDLFSKPASEYYAKWLNTHKDFQHRGNTIPSPKKRIRIPNYLSNLSKEALSHDKASKWWESLTSFISFLRWESKIEDQGYIDAVFPEEMDIFDEKIIRMVLPQEDSIDVVATSEILQALATKVLQGRKNSRRASAEVLGLAWACIALSYSRLPSREKSILDISLPNLCPPAERNPLPTMNILTFLGTVSIPISQTLYDYLSALSITYNPENSKIFKLPARSLRRTLDSAIRTLPNVTKLGKITFLTFMTPPHEAIGHRYQR